MNLTAPISYQGGKARIAAPILDRITPATGDVFHDLCCGCGAVAIELVNRGWDPAAIVMLDAGPWGLFWEAVGDGVFDLDRFAGHCRRVPSRDKIADYMRTLAARPANEETVYVYLLLQAAAFGGKAIWIRDNRWMNATFRSYWQPTATSNRRTPVNPMMPMPETLFERRQGRLSKDARRARALHRHSQLSPKGWDRLHRPALCRHHRLRTHVRCRSVRSRTATAVLCLRGPPPD